MEDSANQKKGPPNYIIANGGIPRSPVPSPVLPKKGQYGALGSRPEEDEDEDEEADGDSVSGSSSKTEDSGIYGSWASGWSGGWRSTQVKTFSLSLLRVLYSLDVLLPVSMVKIQKCYLL